MTRSAYCIVGRMWLSKLGLTNLDHCLSAPFTSRPRSAMSRRRRRASRMSASSSTKTCPAPGELSQWWLKHTTRSQCCLKHTKRSQCWLKHTKRSQCGLKHKALSVLVKKHGAHGTTGNSTHERSWMGGGRGVCVCACVCVCMCGGRVCARACVHACVPNMTWHGKHVVSL